MSLYSVTDSKYAFESVFKIGWSMPANFCSLTSFDIIFVEFYFLVNGNVDVWLKKDWSIVSLLVCKTKRIKRIRHKRILPENPP